MGWFSDTLKDVAGSALSSATGVLIGSAFGQSNSAYASKLDLESSKKLFEYENRNKYQFMVDDLNKAGLNPILAVNGMQGVPVGGMTSGAASMRADDMGVNNGAAARAQIRIAEKNAQTELLRAQAEARLANSRADTEDYMREINGRLVNAKTADLASQVSDRSARLQYDFQDLLMRKEVHGYEVQKIVQEIKHLASMSSLNEAEYKKIMADVNSWDKKLHNEWISTEPGRDLYKIADIIKTLFGAIGTIGVWTGKTPGRIGIN